jgi:hypothetical protein
MDSGQRCETFFLPTEPIVPASGGDQHTSNNHETSKGGKTGIRVAKPSGQPAQL